MTDVDGTCDEAFVPVRVAFEKNFANGDLGASCAVVHRGRLVVDLWGGHRDVAETIPWARDTLVNVWSITKMTAALCVLLLHDRGELSVDDPMARHWPEFSAEGKEGVLVRHVMGHTAGVPGFDPPIDLDQMYDWDHCCARLAAQAPWWEPGSAAGYHSSTQGWLLGELVRRVTGRSIGTFLREEIAEPLGADFHLGLDPVHFPRVAEMRTDEVDPTGTEGGVFAERAGRGEPDHAALVGTERWRLAELPASNGHGNARSVARVLSVLAHGGEIDGIRLLGPGTIERIFEVQADGPDLIMGTDTRLGIGYGLNCPATPVGVNDRTLFWGGWGGSLVVVDVENELTAVYVMNRMLADADAGIRAGGVVFAAHGAAGRLRGD